MAAVYFTVLSALIATTTALDCPQCLHVTHRSYHGLIRSSLDRFYSPLCGYNNITIGSQVNNARLVKCPASEDGTEYKCGLIRGRASVRVDGQQQQDPAITIEMALRMCIQVREGLDDEFCDADDGTQREYLRQALTYYPTNIPIKIRNVLSYKGETCFCSDNQCISGTEPLKTTAAVLFVAIATIFGIIALSG